MQQIKTRSRIVTFGDMAVKSVDECLRCNSFILFIPSFICICQVETYLAQSNDILWKHNKQCFNFFSGRNAYSKNFKCVKIFIKQRTLDY